MRIDKKAIVALGRLSIICREIRTNQLFWGSVMFRMSNDVLEGIELGEGDPVEILDAFSYVANLMHKARQAQFDSLYIPLSADIVK
jgi:hypothetical protein